MRQEGIIRYAANTGWMLGERFLRLVANLFVGIYVARYLGPDHFGLLSYSLSLVALFSTLSLLGLDNIVVRELVKLPDQHGKIIGTSFVLKLCGSIVAIVVLIGVTSMLDISKMEHLMVMIISIGLVFQTANVIEFHFQSLVQSRFVVQAQFVQLLVSSLLKICLVVLQANLVWFAVIVVIESVVLSVGLVVNYRRAASCPLSQPWQFNAAVCKDLLRDSWPLLISGMALSIYMKIDVVMIRYFLNTEAVGNYAAAVRVSESWLAIAVILTTSLYPAIIESKKRDEQQYLVRLQLFYNLMFWLAVVIALPIATFSNMLVQIMYGSDFAPAGPVLALHAWSGVFVFMIIASSRWYLVEGHERSILWRAVFGALLNIGLNLYMIPNLGIVGAALATLLSYGAMATIYDISDPRGRVSFYLKLNTLVLPLSILRKLPRLVKTMIS